MDVVSSPDRNLELPVPAGCLSGSIVVAGGRVAVVAGAGSDLLGYGCSAGTALPWVGDKRKHCAGYCPPSRS